MSDGSSGAPPDPSAVLWLAQSSTVALALAAQSTDGDGNLVLPWCAMRLVIPGLNSFGSVVETLTLIDGVDEDKALEEATSAWHYGLELEEARDGPGDEVKVDAVLTALEDLGIVGRINFTCCRTCAADEIGAERTPSPDADGYAEWGYVYSTRVDAFDLVHERGRLLFGFDAWRPPARPTPGRSAALEVGRTFATLCEGVGLTVDWNGQDDTRIALVDLDWRFPLSD